MVSVIITTFNYAGFVERAMRSILEQSLKKHRLEVVVINDCSTDRTKDILENWEDEVRIFNLEKNVGLAAARNFGIKKAKGQFVVFLDADDFIHSDLLRTQLLFLEENTTIDAVSTDYYMVNEKGAHREHVDATKKPIACGIMFRKDYLYNIGLYDEEFRAREEEDLRIRWLKRYNIHNLCIPLYRYRNHDSNLTKNTENMDFFASKLKEKHEQ